MHLESGEIGAMRRSDVRLQLPAWTSQPDELDPAHMRRRAMTGERQHHYAATGREPRRAQPDQHGARMGQKKKHDGRQARSVTRGV